MKFREGHSIPLLKTRTFHTLISCLVLQHQSEWSHATHYGVGYDHRTSVLSNSLAPDFPVHTIRCRRKRPLLDAMPSKCLSWDWENLTRFRLCLGCILMLNMAKLRVTVLSVQKRVQPSCCSLHDVKEDKDVLWPNTQSKTFRLLQVYKYSLIWQDWFSTLYFAKSIVRPKQVKLIFAHILPHPRPLCSLLVIGDF